MKCVIPGANIKIFGRAIHSLSKIGEELYLEPLPHGLSLRTVNSSRSAYACFVFAPGFFLHYNDGGGQDSAGDSVDVEEDVVKCKIGMKSCLSVFKSLSTLEKTVDKCKVTINMTEARLVFQMYCRHGIVKTHNLAFIECETLQAVFSKDLCPNILTAQSRLLTDVVTNFQTNQEEISVNVCPEKVCVKNYTEDEPDPQKVIHTEMSLDPDEFEGYQVGIDTEITFCLKELRAILAFTESNNYPLSLHFETAGKPIVLSIDSDPTFEGNFVLATLADRTSQVSVSQQSSQLQSHMRTPAANTNSMHTPNIVNNRTNPRMRKNNSTSSRGQGESYVQANGDASASINDTTHRNKSASRAQLLEALSEELGDETTTNHTAAKTTSLTNNKQVNKNNKDTLANKKTDNNRLNEASKSKDNDSSPVIPLVQSSKKAVFERNISAPSDQESDDGDDEDGVPGTPPAKKPRSALGFFGISSQSSSQGGTERNTNISTVNTNNTQASESKAHTVLAADTDSEDD